MTGRGSRMSPKERYLRSVYLNYQVCTDVVRHYFDGLHPPTSLVQYLLDQRIKFENEEKKIPNYQWIQLYPEVLFRADVHIKETYLVSYDRKDMKDYKEFADRMSTIFTYLFDSVDGDQKVKVVNLSRFESGEVFATLEITSQYNPDDRIIQSALEATVKNGHVDASLETSPDGFTFAKLGVSDTYRIEIKLTKVNAAALALKDTKEFRIMAKKLERILLLLFDTVPGTQSVEVEEFRSLTSDCATAICKLTSEKHNDDKMLEEAISIPTSEGRLGKTLKTICTHNGFSFKEVIVFEAEINVKEKFSKTLENSNSNDFKAFANRVQPIIKGLYNSETGEQHVEIVKCRDGPSDTVLVLYHLISHGNNDKEGLRAVTERKIRTGSLSLSYGITDDGFSFETNKCMFEVTLRLAEKYSDSKELTNPKSEDFKSVKEKVQPEILRLYDSVCGSQEIDILRYKIESSGAVHSIIFKLTSSGCSDESTLKEPVEKQIQTGLLGSSLKVCATDLHFQKLTETVFYQVTLNVKKTFTDELKKKHSADYLAFSKFVQTVLSTQYEKVPGKQEFNVMECQQGPSGTNSTVVIIDVISKDCTNNVYMQLCQPVKNLITLGKLELALTTSFEDFSFRITRGSKPVSSKCFDLSLLITLLRKDSNVKPPKNGYDFLPSKDDISDGAQIATIKHYRNELAHPRDAKMDEHEFDSLWSNLENAVRILGKDKFMKAVDDASTMKLDSSTEEVLIRMVQQDRQILQLEEDVTKLYQRIEKLTKQTEDQSASTQVEISEIKEDIGEKEEQILKIKTDMQTVHTELHRIEKKFDEKFRVQDERNDQQDEMNRNMESGIEENRRDIQRLDPQNERNRTLIGRTEQLEKKANESKKMLTIHHESIQTIVQEQEEQRMDVKELKEKQQSMSNSPATKGDAHHRENLHNIRHENKDLKLSSIHRQPMSDNSTVNDSIVVGKTVVGEMSSNIEEWHLVENYIYSERYYEKLKKCMEKKQCVILKGLIGTGKSELALQYCYNVRKYNPNIIVYKLRCTDTNMFQKSLRELCKCLSNINIIEEEDTQKETLNKLEDYIVRGMRDRDGYQFLLLDDVKLNSKRAVNDFLKKCKRVGNIKLIVTTSVSLDLDPITDEVVEVSGFSENEAVDFLAYGKKEDRENYLQLARKFSCNPKGLHIARSYMSQAGLSAGVLTRKLNVPLDMLRLEKTVAVSETFMDETLFSSLVSIIRDMHKKYKKEGKEHIFEMILLLQFLEVENIPVVLFTKTSYEASNFSIDDLIYEIKNSSFGTIDEHDDNRKINTHDLVKSALEIYTTQMEDEVLKANEKLLQKLLRAFFLLIDQDNKHTSDLQRHTLLVPHARAVLEKLKAEMNNKLEDGPFRNLEYVIQVIYLKHIIGYTYSFNEMFSEASKYFEDAKKDLFELLNLEKTFQIEFDMLLKADCHLLQNGSLVCKKTKALYSAIDDFISNTKHLFSIKNVSEDYVINKYRNAEDVNMLSRLLEKHTGNLEESTHLIKNEYVQLSHRGYAVPLELLSKEFLFELVISVLHTYGRRLFYLPDKRDIQTAQIFFSYLAVAHELSKLISENEDRDKVRLSSVLSERSVIQSVLDFSCRKTEVHASTLNVYISICKSRLNERVNYFEFGVLKVLCDDSDYFTVIWLKLIIRCYTKLIRIENTDMVCKEALAWGEYLSEKMKSMKNNTNYPKLVCSLGDLYFATGKILESEKCFEELLPKYAEVTDKSLASKSTLKRYERKACISYIRCRMNRSCETEEHFDEDTLQRLEAYKLLLQGYVNDLEDLKEMEVQLKGRLRGETEFYCRLQIPKPNC